MNILISTPTEPEWKPITEKELNERRYELAVMANWKDRLFNHLFIYTDKCKIKAEGFEEPSSEWSGDLPETVIARNTSGKEWTLAGDKLETMVEALGGFMTRYKERLVSGEIIVTPIVNLRLADTKTCPMCGFGFRGMGSLSRSNNHTEICNNCGDREAFMDYEQDKKTTLNYYRRPLASIQTPLYSKVMNEWNQSPEALVKEWAHRQYSITLQGEEEATEDLRNLIATVKEDGYEGISEWISEQFRQYAAQHTHP